MKTINVCILIFVINTIAITATAQNKSKNQNSFEISGAALVNDQRVGDYAVSIYLDGTRIDSMYSSRKKPLFFTLDYNQVYSCLIQKKGFQDKVVIVNTNIPQGLKAIEDHSFDFEIEMTETLKNNSPEIEDYPVAIIMISEADELLKASEGYYQLTHQETNNNGLTIGRNK